MRSGLIFTGISAAVAGAVALLGGSMVAAPARVGVWAGVGVAFACQLVIFWLLFVGVFPDRRVLAHLVGVLGRLLVFAVTALVWVPRAGLPPAPTLFALVAVFFATTLVESVFVQPNESLTRR
jgi:hypothetical protein